MRPIAFIISSYDGSHVFVINYFAAESMYYVYVYINISGFLHIFRSSLSAVCACVNDVLSCSKEWDIRDSVPPLYFILLFYSPAYL